MRRFLPILFVAVVAILAAAGGWQFGRRSEGEPPRAPGKDAAARAGRKPLYYQSPMHPWIRSDHPGQCTICGMDLVAIYETTPTTETNPGAPTASGGVVMLPGESPRVAGIASAPVLRRPLVRTLRVAGTIDDDQTRHRILAAPVRGRLDRLLVNTSGVEVAEGEPVAEIFSRELLAAISDYLAARGEGGLKKAAAGKLRQLGLTKGQIAALPERDPESLTVPLLAPMSGTVVARKVVEGEWVNEGETLLEIADFRKMWFVFDAYERDLPWLQPGQKVEIRTPSHPGRVFTAPITFIDPNLDAATRTARVRVELENPLLPDSAQALAPAPAGEEGAARPRPRRLFLHRLFAEGTVRGTRAEALTIPRTAVLWPGGQPRVFVDEGHGVYRRTPVVLGRRGDQRVEVLAGLEEGQKVVVRGGVLLDGQAALEEPLELTREERPLAPKPGTASAGTPAPELCPVSHEELGSMGEPFVFHHEGREVRLCCKMCREDFEADPGGIP